MTLSEKVKKADSAFRLEEYAKAAILYRDIAESMEYESWVAIGDNGHCNAHIFWNLEARARKESLS